MAEEPISRNSEVEATIPLPGKIQAVPNWRKVFKTWSFWFHCTSVILTLIEQILPFVGLLEPTMSVQTYAILMFALNGLGIVSRFIKQKNLWEYHPEGEKSDDQPNS